MTYLSQSAAATAVDPHRPPCRDTLQAWHDKVSGPRDTSGRRIWTPEICEQIREARQAKKAQAA